MEPEEQLLKKEVKTFLRNKLVQKLMITAAIVCALLMVIFFSFLFISGTKDLIHKLRELKPIPALSFLSTTGQNIVNEDYERVLLKGVNFGSWLLWEGCALGVLDCPSYPEYKLKEEMAKRIGAKQTEYFFDLILDNFIQKEDFKKVKDMGMNFVRLGFHHRYVRENELTLLDEAVGWAKEAGIYVILNMHAAPGAQAPTYFADSDGKAYLWEDSKYQKQFLDLWEILSTRYKDEPAVAGYEILNEPVVDDDQQLTDLYIRTIDLIRDIDNRHIIFLDGNDLASDFSALDYDFGENIVYVFHTYIDTQEGLEQLVESSGYYKYREKFNVPLMCNEYDNVSFNQYFEDNNISWAPWTYKSLSEAPPFFSAPEDNLWRNWLKSLNQSPDQPKENTQEQFIQIIEASSLSVAVKQEMVGIISSNKLGALKNMFSQLQNRFPADSNELENVYTQLKDLSAEIKYAADAAWLDAFTASINSMSKTELNNIMQSLQTRYWQGGGKDRRHAEAVSVETEMICRLMGEGKTANITGDIWEGDLGVSFMHNNQLYLLTGDTGGGENFSPNVLAYTNDLDASNCLDLTWETKINGGPGTFFPIIDPDSTVPAGAISINNAIYVFMMDVTDWTPPATACSLLVKSEDNGQTSSLIWQGEVDNKFVNIAPVLSAHPVYKNKQAVYLIASGKYRQSPVYLAYSEIDDIENKSKYQYFIGLENGLPQWSYNEDEAVPIIDKVKVGELSAQWNNYLNKWLLAFMDYNSSNIYFQTADNPWGPWSESRLVYSGSKEYDWYSYRITRLGDKIPWGIPYAPYLLPGEYSSENSNKVYYVLSLWNPYTIFLMEVSLDDIL